MNASILIVDDSHAILSALSELLASLGVENVKTVDNGEDALHAIKQEQHPFDAIFVDLHMDGMDGLELMLRLNDEGFKGGVVIMSALEARLVDFTVEIIKKCDLKLLGSIEKPFKKSVLAFMVKRIESSLKPLEFSGPQYLKRREILRSYPGR